MKNKFKSLLLAIALVFSFTGCSNTNTISNNQQSVVNQQEIATEENTKSEQSNTISLENIPEYSGTAYVEINENIPEFTDEEKQNTTSFKKYSDLDFLGRCGVAFANVGQDIMPTEKREAIGMIKPSGWHTVKYPEIIKDRYLYNRCHLVGFQLVGTNADKRNLITGTRYLNVDGMLPFENQVADFVKETNYHVLYRVTPIFKDNELVARGVQMEGYSVEDKGKGICFNVYVYNVQPGITIDYVTGNSEPNTNVDINNDLKNNQNKINITDSNVTTTETNTYILNDNTKKFHKPTCTSVKQMNDENKKEWNGNRETLLNQGYSPCGNCHP